MSEIFEAFPNAQFIYVCRDGRDVAVSMRQNSQHIGLRYDVRYEKDGLLAVEYCAETWRTFVNAYRPWQGDDRCHLARYEDLVVSPEKALTHLCAFLNVPFESALLDFYKTGTSGRKDVNSPHLMGVKEPLYRTKVGRYRRSLSRQQIEIFERCAGRELRYLGYELEG